MTVTKHRKFVCTSTKETTTSKHGNSNKFWEGILYDDGTVETKWGRVGDKGQSQSYPGKGEKFFNVKCNEKLSHGYKEIEIVKINSISDPTEDPIQSISKGDSEITDLIKYLKTKNIHNITSSTVLEYDESTGLFRTPLGIVSQDVVNQAKDILNKIQIMGGNSSDDVLDDLSNRYMMLIPTNIGRDRPTYKRLFPDTDSIKKQCDVIDGLQGSLDMISKGSVTVEKKDPVKLFDVDLIKSSQVDFDRITKFYRSGVNWHHDTIGYKINRLFNLSIVKMRDSFRNDINNVKELWHGTSEGNILSIMARGLLIMSNAVNGRMYGNGVYFSDQATKSLQYSRGNKVYMFVCQVAMGKEYIPVNHCYQTNFKPPSGYDSCFAKGGTSGVYNNEMIVYDTKQINPMFLVEFTK